MRNTKEAVKSQCSSTYRDTIPAPLCPSAHAHAVSAGFCDGGEGSRAFSIRHTASPHDKDGLCKSLPRPQCGTTLASPGCFGISFIWCYFFFNFHRFPFWGEKNDLRLKLKPKKTQECGAPDTQRENTQIHFSEAQLLFFFLFSF